MPTGNTSCPRCKSKLLNENGRPYCLFCGELTDKQKLPNGNNGHNNWETHIYIRMNAEKIAGDSLYMSTNATARKWGIALQTVYNIPEVREARGLEVGVTK